MSKEYEKELERTIEHLHKVIEEKTTLIDQQREMLDKFIKGEISVNSLSGYVDAPSYQAVAGPGPLGSIGQAVYTGSNSSSSSDDDEPNMDPL